MFAKNVSIGGVFLAAIVFATPVLAEGPCGICNEQVVTNSSLARCFLENYPVLAGKTSSAIVVDLSACEQERSIVAPLAGPDTPEADPDLTFVVTKAQLVCLKDRLEQDGLSLDPVATIDLGSCQ